jgi:Amt family ammonium transporter
LHSNLTINSGERFMQTLKQKGLLALAGIGALVAPALSWAEEAAAEVTEAASDAAAAVATISAGDTSWMLISSALVLLMIIPGLALYYAGMVRAKNALSTMMQVFAVVCVGSIVWFAFGYSLAFGDGGANNAWIGDLSKAFLAGMMPSDIKGTIPEVLFVMFQMTFALITPAIIIGGFAERMKFSAVLLFSALWIALVYVPIAHWVWGGGFLSADGVLDFAGGTVVHINAGIAGLVAAIMIGKRKGYGTQAMPPHSMMMTMVGGAMLWVGWFGFNAGSELAADGVASMAMLVTQIATAAAALAWMLAEWMTRGKPTGFGLISGAVAGLVAITPAAGFVGPTGALLLGLIAGVVAFVAATSIKRAFGYDDALDAFGVHAVAGIVGALLTGIFVDASFGGKGLADGVSMMSQFMIQAEGVGVTVIYDVIATAIILKAIDIMVGLRITEEEEVEGMDLALHNERAYNH